MFRQLNLLKPRLFSGSLQILNRESMAQSLLLVNWRRSHVNNNNNGGLLRTTLDDPFIFPNGVALAFSCKSTTPLASVCDYADQMKIAKECISVEALKCPVLMEEYVQQLFPITSRPGFEVTSVNIINIKYSNPEESDPQTAVEHFILLARQMSMNLQGEFWADFINPISGRPFFSENVSTKKYTIDSRFRGINMAFGKNKGCLIIKPNAEYTFSGAIYTTAPLQLFT